MSQGWVGAATLRPGRGGACLSAVEQIAQESGGTPSAIALAWLLAQPGVAAPILGARSVEQLEACLKSLTVTLTPEQLARLKAASAWEREG